MTFLAGLSTFSTLITLPSLLAGNPAQQLFGTVSTPPGVDRFDQASGGSIGLLFFVSVLIQTATIAAGVWVFVNIVLAGYDYIVGAGDSSAQQRARDRITMSVIGLVIIVSAHTIIAIGSAIIFGNPGFVLQPVLPTPTSTPTPI
ncbi:MAG: hypothetical protein COU69_00655 [Candidatus Pacebacteria bacterium CG10_big_fil_rev_8_21_14_0_10_56_10]|nr:MAG: hypothetical protein COU69_00655 [Candidatus Pacebacteria bacterium CG10_big_fil_rev_8_21_14_0_10_56_10]